MTYMASLTLEPLPRGHEIYNFRPFIGHHYCILSLSDPCLGIEMKIFKEIIYFHYNDLYGHDLAQEPLPLG